MSSTVAGSLAPSANIMTNGKQPKLEPKASGIGSKGTSASSGPNLSTSGVSEKHESWQMELLMERLRSKAKSSQYKSFQEMSKSARMSLLEKRYALDAVEKSNLQKTLDSMQYCIKVTSRQGLVERLDCLTRQLGLKLSEDTSGLFISSDMFYLEIILDQSGTVQDVKVHHECKMKQQSCSELVSCLQRGDFVDFTTQLEGLASIYQLNAEKKIKVNAFVALQALETDLYNLYSLSTQHFTDIHSLLHKSPLGVVQKRRGGHAMKLTYFVAPYDLLDLESKKLKPLNTELLSAEKIGYSVSVNLEASTANKLQIQPLLVQQGNSPMYSPIEKHNSTSLPATFVLRLNKPIALNVTALKQISAITGDHSVGTAERNSSSSMMNLIIQHESNGAVNNIAKGLFVTLPDQYHCYYMSENKNVQGVIVSSIPFTEPQHVPKILVFLRQQALFNQLLTSCIRNNGSSNTRIADYENLLVFEVAALSCQYITVSLQHPYEESLAMVELDLRNSLAIQVRIFCNGYESDDMISTRISLVMQRTVSIPITLRALIKIWEEEYETKFKGKIGMSTGGNGGNDESNFSLPMGPDDGGGSGSGGPGGGGGGSGLGMNGQHTGGMNGVGIAHQECSDAKRIKLEPVDPAKKRRTGEDFRNSPKSSKVETTGRDGDDMPEVQNDDDCDESTNMSSGDSSNSLGGNQTNATQQISSSLLSPAGLLTTVVPPGDTNQSLASMSIENTDFSSLNAELVRSSNISEIARSAESDSTLTKHQTMKPAEDMPSYTTSVSITPIAIGKPNLASNSVLNNIGLDKRPGIEIIPLANAGSSMSSSITITPIPMGSSKSGNSEKRISGSNIPGSGASRKSSSSESDRAKLEKKKKRKHEEQLAQLQMGPPHKILSKNASDGPTSPSGSSRKFSASPIPSKSGGSSAQQHSTGGSPSPKHSPVHHSSPKHQGNYGTSSPKHISGGSSGGGKPSMSALKSAASGGSPSSKSTTSGVGAKEEGSLTGSSSVGISNRTSGSSGVSSSRDRDRERERIEKKSGYSSSSSSPKLKTPAVKLKHLDLANCGASLSSGVQLELMNSNSSGGSSGGSCSIDFSDTGLFSGNATDLSKNSSIAAASTAGMLLLQHAMKNKKSSLSAVIDKLKSAQSGDESTLMLLPELVQQAGFTINEASISGKSTSSSTAASTTTSVSNLSGSPLSSSATTASATAAAFAANLSTSTIQGKSNEYMVKPSSDGIKLTIQNKKGSKSSSSSSASSKSSSKSGLKPGVSSGPVSKKLPSSQSFSGSFPSASSTGSKSSSSGSSLSKVPFQKSNSSGSLLNTGSSLKSSSKSSSNSSSSSSGSKDKSRSSSKSSSSSSSLMATNTAMAVNALNVMKKMISFSSSIQNMEGFVKTLDTKFQIPKLSARSGGSDTDKLKDSRPASSSAPNTPLSNVSQSPTGVNDFSLPFNKLPGDVSPLHSAMLPNVMQKMFSSHENAILLRRSPNLDHQTNNSRDGFPSLYGKRPTTPTTPTASVAPSFPSPVGLHGHTMDFSSGSDSIDGSNLMRPPSRPSSTLSNHSSSDKLIDGTMSSNSMDGLSSSSSAQAITAAAVAAQLINKLDNTQLVAALKNHHLNALSNAAAAAAAAAAASNSAGPVPVTSPASVSVHIVKSPAASPLPLHGGPGSVVDDELMDEALVGISGK